MAVALTVVCACGGCMDHPIGSLRASKHWKPIFREDSGGWRAGFVNLHDLVFVTRQRGWIVRETSGGQGISYELLRSEDGGATWHPEAFSVAVIRFRGDVGWAVEYRYRDDLSRLPNRIWRTEDAGRSWRSGETEARDYVALSVVSDLEAWAICQPPVTLHAPSPHAGLLHTRDAGRTWHEVRLPANGRLNDLSDLFFLDRDHGWIISLDSKPEHGPHGEISRTFVKPILSTADGGRTFRKAEVRVRTSWRAFLDRPRIQFVDSHNGWAAISATSLLRSLDGGASWREVVPRVKGSPSLPVLYDCSFRSPDEGWAVGDRTLHTTDGGNTWAEVDAGADVENARLREVFFLDVRTGWIVGEGGYGPNDMTRVAGHWMSYVLKYVP